MASRIVRTSTRQHHGRATSNPAQNASLASSHANIDGSARKLADDLLHERDLALDEVAVGARVSVLAPRHVDELASAVVGEEAHDDLQLVRAGRLQDVRDALDRVVVVLRRPAARSRSTRRRCARARTGPLRMRRSRRRRHRCRRAPQTGTQSRAGSSVTPTGNSGLRRGAECAGGIGSVSAVAAS